MKTGITLCVLRALTSRPDTYSHGSTALNKSKIKSCVKIGDVSIGKMWNISLLVPQCSQICGAYLGEQENLVKIPLIIEGGHQIQAPTTSWHNIQIKLLGKNIILCDVDPVLVLPHMPGKLNIIKVQFLILLRAQIHIALCPLFKASHIEKNPLFLGVMLAVKSPLATDSPH